MTELVVGHLTLQSGQGILNYVWKIDNLSYYFNRDSTTCLKSPIFSTTHSNNAEQWRLLFYPKNPNKELNMYSSLFLQYFGKNEIAVSSDFAHSFGECGIWGITRKSLGKQLFGPQRACHGFQDYLKHSNLCTSQSIQLSCQIFFDLPLAFPDPIYRTIEKKGGLPEQSSQDDCQGDFNQLFETELLADVTVKIGQKKKSLHKAILASRSDVFRAMFQHDMAEKAQNVVNVVDISLDVAMEMFRYMYTGKVNNIEKLPVDELLIAAEKYAITGLKAMCEKILGKDLNFDNALQHLTLASVHNSPDLKKVAMEFVVKYLNRFADNPQFKLLDQNIVCEIVSAVAKNKY